MTWGRLHQANMAVDREISDCPRARERDSPDCTIVNSTQSVQATFRVQYLPYNLLDTLNDARCPSLGLGARDSFAWHCSNDVVNNLQVGCSF